MKYLSFIFLWIIFLLPVFFLNAQSIKLISEVSYLPIQNKAELTIYAISTTDTSYTLDSLHLSYAYIDSCQTRSHPSTGEVFASWQLFYYRYIDSVHASIYNGRRYDKRYNYFDQNHAAATKPLVVPDSGQAPLWLLQIDIFGMCPYLVHLESTAEHGNNYFYDTSGNALSYIIEDRGWRYAGCSAGFIASQDSPRKTLDYSFTGWPQSDSVEWEMGDGTTISDSLRHTHRYAQPGIYQVCLTVVDTFGCVGKTCVPIKIGLDTPVCSLDSMYYRLLRDKGETAVRINYRGKGDSILWDMGDGSRYYQEGPNFGVPEHHYPGVDTFTVMAVEYANWYNGAYQCADTGYLEVITISPEVRICAQLGPGNLEDTLFYSVENLLDSTIAVSSIGLTAFLDKSCLNIEGYHSRVTPFFNYKPPFTPNSFVYDTVSRVINGVTYERQLRHVEVMWSVDVPQPPRYIMLPPGKDSAFTLVGFNLEGTCKTAFEYQETLKDYFGTSGIAFAPFPGSSFQMPAIAERGCYPSVNIDPSPLSEKELIVWPNPTDDLVFANLKGAGPVRYHIRVRDALGKEVIYWLRPFMNGIPIRLNLKDLPSGMYYIEVQDEKMEFPILSEPVLKK